MTDTLEMFDCYGHALKYPHVAGSKREGTSSDAAPTVSEAETLREQVLCVLQSGDWTADEIAGVLGKSVLSIRPRTSELIALGKIRMTSQRRRNVSGKMATVLKWIDPSHPF